MREVYFGTICYGDTDDFKQKIYDLAADFSRFESARIQVFFWMCGKLYPAVIFLRRLGGEDTDPIYLLGGGEGKERVRLTPQPVQGFLTDAEADRIILEFVQPRREKGGTRNG